MCIKWNNIYYVRVLTSGGRDLTFAPLTASLAQTIILRWLSSAGLSPDGEQPLDITTFEARTWLTYSEDTEIDIQTQWQTDRQTDIHTDLVTDRHSDRHKDRQTDRVTDLVMNTLCAVSFSLSHLVSLTTLSAVLASWLMSDLQRVNMWLMDF